MKISPTDREQAAYLMDLILELQNAPTGDSLEYARCAIWAGDRQAPNDEWRSIWEQLSEVLADTDPDCVEYDLSDAAGRLHPAIVSEILVRRFGLERDAADNFAVLGFGSLAHA